MSDFDSSRQNHYNLRTWTRPRRERYRKVIDQMAFIPLPNGIQLCFLFTTNSQKWQFCLNLQKSAGPPLDTDLQQATGDGAAWWTSALQALLANDSQLSEIVATDMSVEGGPQFRQTIGTNGSVSGGGAPLGTAVVVSGRTAKRGRSYRGRSYIGGIAKSDISTPTTALTALGTALANAFASLKSTLDGHGLDIVVASRQHNGSVTSPADMNEVTSFVVDTLFDSQRRRLAGRGT